MKATGRDFIYVCGVVCFLEECWLNWGVGACEKISFKREGAPKKTSKRINWLKFQHRENKSFFFFFFFFFLSSFLEGWGCAKNEML